MLSDIIPEGFKDDVSQTLTEHNFKNTIINYFQSNGFVINRRCYKRIKLLFKK